MDPERVAELFQQAFELEGTERDAFLASLDLPVREELQSLLAAHDASGDFLEDSALSEAVDVVPDMLGSALVGSTVGAWQIEALIHSGGMGSVFSALRVGEDFSQRAALKLVKVGFESPDLVARFTRERQLMAGLDHPNIARLLDGGTTEDGLPWLAMDFVEGLPIEEYADAHGLSMQARLALFNQVAEAIAYLHRNLITHRDIKSSNVLVDGSGRVKVLDFGIANLLGEAGDEAEATIERRLSPGSAAPEQLRGGPISTATDVYGLGVLLYRLLGGLPPYRITADLTAAQIEELICDREPPLVSQGIRQASDAGQITERRGTTPPRLVAELVGDIDTIVAKCLRKEPERRYASVAELREDLQRYHDNRPIAARRDSTPYRVSKFLRRHSRGLAVTVLVFLALGVGLSAALWQAEEARQQRDRAQAMNTFMQEVLGEADPYTSDVDRTVRDVLTDASALLSERFADKPLLEASLRQSVGGVQLTLLDLDGGEANLRRASQLLSTLMPADAELRLRTESHLAWLAYEREDYDQSIAIYEGIIDRLTDDHDPEFRALMHNDLGVVLVAVERWEEVVWHEKEAIRLSPESPDRTASMVNLGYAFDGLGRLEEAKRYYLQAIERLRGEGERGVVADLAHALNNYGNVLSQQDRDEEALPLYLESLSVRYRVFGESSDSVAVQHLNVGRLLLDMQRPTDAVEHLQRAVEIFPNYREESSIYTRVARASHARAVLLTSSDGGQRQSAIDALEAVVAGFAQDADLRESRFMDQTQAWLDDANNSGPSAPAARQNDAP